MPIKPLCVPWVTWVLFDESRRSFVELLLELRLELLLVRVHLLQQHVFDHALVVRAPLVIMH